MSVGSTDVVYVADSFGVPWCSADGATANVLEVWLVSYIVSCGDAGYGVMAVVVCVDACVMCEWTCVSCVVSSDSFAIDTASAGTGGLDSGLCSAADVSLVYCDLCPCAYPSSNADGYVVVWSSVESDFLCIVVASALKIPGI